MWRATYQGVLSDSYLAGLSYETREEEWAKRLAHAKVITFVVEDEQGKLLGFASAGPERHRDPAFPGEIYAVYVLPEHQRKGIGKRLVVAIAQALAAAGAHAMIAWVARAGPSAKFFEAVGAKEYRAKQDTLGDVELEKIGFGWTDTGIIGAR